MIFKKIKIDRYMKKLNVYIKNDKIHEESNLVPDSSLIQIQIFRSMG